MFPVPDPTLLWAIVLFLAVTIVTYVIFYITPWTRHGWRRDQGATPEASSASPSGSTSTSPSTQQYGRFLRQLVGEQSLGDLVRQPPGE